MRKRVSPKEGSDRGGFGHSRENSLDASGNMRDRRTVQFADDD